MIKVTGRFAVNTYLNSLFAQMELAQQVSVNAANELWPEGSIFLNLLKTKTIQTVFENFVLRF